MALGGLAFAPCASGRFPPLSAQPRLPAHCVGFNPTAGSPIASPFPALDLWGPGDDAGLWGWLPVGQWLPSQCSCPLLA